MISSIKGVLVQKSPAKAEVEAGGIGYELMISLCTFEKLPHCGQEVKLFVHYHVREDAHLLFGFAEEEEREAFRLLIQVNRVGPKVALSVLSGISASELKETVLSDDVKSIAAIGGVGKKTAERIIMELREKIIKIEEEKTSFHRGTPGEEEISGAKERALADALSALESLGYKRAQTYRICLQVLSEGESKVEALVRQTLRRMTS